MLSVPWCVAFFAASHVVGRLGQRSQVWMGHVLGAVHAAYLTWSVMNMTLWRLPLYELLWHQALPVSYIHVFQTYIVLDSLTLTSSETWSTWLHHAMHLYLTQLLKWMSRGALLGMCLSLQELSSIFLNLRKVLPAAAVPALNRLFLVTYVCTRIVLVGCLLEPLPAPSADPRGSKKKVGSVLPSTLVHHSAHKTPPPCALLQTLRELGGST